MKKQMTLVAMGLGAMWGAVAQTPNRSQAEALVKQMTLEERAQLVVGMGMKIPGTNMTIGGPVVGQTEDRVPGAAGTTLAIPRLQLKGTVVADGPAGLRISPFRGKDSSKSYFATAFPIATLLASTWDTELVQQVGKAMGNEVREYGIDVILAPALNIHRTPLGGRNFEYFSEDPLVSGAMATAMVKGIESNGVGTSIKHYAANNQETNRNLVNTIASERALREIYLRGFEMVVKGAQPWTVMSSYNKINGTYASQSYDLLTTILRKEWGFKGLVMTDWFGGDNAVEQMKAGNDLLMPGMPNQMKEILEAVKNGKLAETVLNENAIRVVEMALRSPSQLGLPFSNTPDLKAHAGIARQAAADGMVLLRNEKQALPLPAAIKRIAAFGNTSYDFIAGGTGSGDVNEAYTVSLAEGLSKAGLLLDAGLTKAYEAHLVAEKLRRPKPRTMFDLPEPLAEMEVSEAQLQAAVAGNDVAMITLGRNSGEFKDRKVENDFDLSAAEQKLIADVTRVFHSKGKKVIVVVNTGGVMETASWKNKPDAILIAWQGGQEGGHAVADVLTGKVNPSGKLTSTFPVKYTDVPAAANFPGKDLSNDIIRNSFGLELGKLSEVTYEEGIYVGYRYYSSFGKAVSYPFGYGLSYTSFAPSGLVVGAPAADGSVAVSITVTNTGKVAGKEVVQVYLQAPKGGLDKPAMELKAFGKTRLLQPGEKQTLSMTLEPKALASFVTNSRSWVAAAGTYTVMAGNSSAQLPLKASFKLAKDLVVEKCAAALVPQVAIQEWKAK